MTRQIVVEIVGDASKFNAATSSAVKNAGGLSSGLKNIGKGMAVGAGIAAVNLIGSSVDLVVGSLGQMDKAFKDDQVSQTLLSQALKNNIPNWDGNVDGVEAYASAQARLGFADDDVRASIGQLIGVTHDLNEAQKLNSLAQDLARAKGIDLATASDIVTKAYQGNGKALKGLGIDIAGATTGAELLDAAQKNVRNSAEEWAATSEGKTAVSQTKVGEAMEKIGAVIDKVAVVAMPLLADAFVFIADKVAEVMPTVETIISHLIPVLKTVGEVAGVVFRGIGVAVGIAQKVIATAAIIIIKVIRTIIQVFQGVASVVQNVFRVVSGVIRGAINAVIRIVNFVIGAINRIQVHIHVGPVNLDWNGLQIKKIPTLHAGGIVPGMPGSETLALLQAGERVIPRNRAKVGTGDIVFNFYGPVYGQGPALDDFMHQVTSRVRVATGL